MKVYLDTSSIIKLYKREEETSDVERIIESFLEERIGLYASSITVLELVRGLRRAGLSESYCSRIGEDFVDYESRGLVLIPISDEVIQKALHYVKRNMLPAMDAIHAASAVGLADVFVTNDEHFLKESFRKELKGVMDIRKPSETVA